MISSIWGMRWKVTSNIGKDWGLLPPICEAKAITLSGLKLLISGHARTAQHSLPFSERPRVGALYMTIVHPLYSCVLGRVPKNLIYVLACHPPHDFPMQFSNKSKQAPLLHFSLSPVHIVSLGQRKQIYFFSSEKVFISVIWL